MAAITGRPLANRTTIRPSRRSRFYGLGSVFAKTLRDSRRATIVVAAVLGLLLLMVSVAVAWEFSTPASRQELADLIRAVPPILAGLAGKPVNVDTIGGYVQYKYGTFFPLIVGLWSILALSGTLAIETRRGSLEFIAALPMTRRRIAIEKLFAHIFALTIAMSVVFVSVAIVGSAVAELPGDEISVGAAAAYALWLGLLALAAGSVAFAVAPFLGRGSAVGIASGVMFAGFILNGYQVAIPELAPFANLTWFGWTTDHIPLAGQFDWPSLVPVAAVAIILSIVGVEAFARRDLGATTVLPTPSLPRTLMGLGGPTTRAASENLNLALSWGIGLGLFGLVLAGSGGSFTEQLAKSQGFMDLLETIFPGVDLASVGGFLELVFVGFGLVLAGLAAATLVGRWASTETSGRVEMLLATPLDRARWVVAEGVAALLAIVLIVAITAIGILIGASLTGGDIVTPATGTVVIGLYAAAMTGIGFAIGGVFGTGFAGALVAIVTIATWAIGVLGPALGLPDALQSLVLSAHFGQPMVGQWDATGVVASAALAIAGVAVGAWGFARRDLRG